MSELLTTGEVSRLTGFSLSKVRRLIELGRLPAINTSTETRPRWAVRRQDLDLFLTPSNLGDRPQATASKPVRRKRIDTGVRQVF